MLSHGDAATSGYMTRVHVQKGEEGGGPLEGIRRYTKINTTPAVALSLLFFKRDMVLTEQLSKVLVPPLRRDSSLR
jgi:hypothetical protein